tara:strand:- start:278 stop:442 length:165 start_codon:yes stop_codon:yes gene_type:complete
MLLNKPEKSRTRVRWRNITKPQEITSKVQRQEKKEIVANASKDRNPCISIIATK